MENTSFNSHNLTGQKYVERLSEDTLRMITVNHDQATPYLDVDLRNQAKAEASTKRDYYGRYLFELLQNANDAITAAKDDPKWKKLGHYRVRIELTETALIVANDGIPFLEKDVNSIYRWGESSKDPNKSVGHKGIGFKSVLEITESPEIFSQIVQFRFDRKTCYQEVKKIVKRNDLELPITRFVFPYPVDRLKADKSLVQALLAEGGFATVIRLPLRIGQSRVIERIQTDIQPTLLLFLNGIDEIEVRIAGQVDKIICKETKPATEPNYSGQDVTLSENNKSISRWLLFDSPKQTIGDREIIKELEDDNWSRVQKVGYAVAFPLDGEGHLQVAVKESRNLFVYFPTDLDTALPYLIHGDFYIDSARKQINPDRKYNKWLGKQIAKYLSTTVVPELVNRFPQNERVVRVLMPRHETSGFISILHAAILERLKRCSFVPTAAGKSECPTKIMFTPPGAAVDISKFQRFFSPQELSRFFERRQFPLSVIENDEKIIDFLISLDAKRLQFENVFRLFDRRPIVENSTDYAALYSFLWKWYNNSSTERWLFVSELSDCHCVVTDRGSWIKPHERLYHAKIRQETAIMPRSVRVDLVHPAVYDSEGQSGAPYRLLDILRPRVRSYDAPDIIRSAIIPLFESGKFRSLSVEQRNEVYRYLFEYWRTRRSGGGDSELEKAIRAKVQIPARRITNQRQDEWRLVTEVYLSSRWSDDKRLEKIYKDFENITFLYEIRGLNLSQVEVREWAKFWEWLGVNTMPRILVDEAKLSSLDNNRWNRIRTGHAHAGTEFWLAYLEKIKSEYSHCPKHGFGYRQLCHSESLEGFAELVQIKDGVRLQLLYELLAENWPSVKNRTNKAQVYCSKSNCPQYARSQDVPSFLDYLLRETEWIPTQTAVDGRTVIELRKPSHCWFVSPSEDPIVRNLIPTPLTTPDQPGHREFCRHIGMRFIDEAKLDDLVDLLRHLPEHYPDPEIVISSGRRKTTRALPTFSRWILRRINNILISLDARQSPLARTVPLIAQEGDSLRYIHPPEYAFFADDTYHSPRWKEYLPIVSMDDNWGAVAQYLGLKFVSKHIVESCTPGTQLDLESSRLENRFKVAFPYLLAIVNSQRASSIQEIVRYLSKLQISVVDSLVVHRSLTIPPEKVIADTEAKVYLEEKRLKRVGSAGRAPRTGVLYVRKGFEENYDILAGPLAQYIDIPGLADAFALLLDRGGKEKRLRFLEVRSLHEEHVEEMRQLLGQLGISDEPEQPEQPDDSAFRNHLLGQLPGEKIRQLTAFPSKPPAPSVSGSGPKPHSRSQPTSTTSEPIAFPEINLSQIRVTTVKVSTIPLMEMPENSTRDGHRGGSSGSASGHSRDWEEDQKLRNAYGKRGEELVKRLEIARLRKLGFESPEEHVRWLREEGNNSADHDLESKDYINGDLVDIFIEVKSTPGEDFRFEMSTGELKCALFYGERYRLYRIININTATPQPYLFTNPYILWQEKKAWIEPKDTYVSLPDPRKLETRQETMGGE